MNISDRSIMGADDQSIAEVDTHSFAEADDQSIMEADTQSFAEVDDQSIMENDTLSPAEVDDQSFTEADTHSLAEVDDQSILKIHDRNLEKANKNGSQHVPNEDLYAMSAVSLAAEIRKRRLGVEELTRAYLDRIDKYGGPDGLNCIAERNEAVLAQAKAMDNLDPFADQRNSPLFGLPILIKDNIDVAGMHTTAGSLALADNLVSADAPITAALKHSGALILGKTNMTEFANYTTVNMPGGYSSRGGQVLHAYDPKKNPSGSSSGSAVAMSAGLCAAAIGTDTSFSIVGCATVNGVTGLKPTHGALSAQGIVPIAHSLDSAGPLTKTLEDALLVYSAMRTQTGTEHAACPVLPVKPLHPSEIRLAVNTSQLKDVSPDQLALCEGLLTAMAKDGTSIQEVLHPRVPEQRDIMRCEFLHDLEEYLAGTNARLRTLAEIVTFYEADPKHMMKYGDILLREALEQASGRMDDEIYRIAMDKRAQLRAQLFADLKDIDACVMLGSTNLMHFVGFPSVALRLGMGEDGTPGESSCTEPMNAGCFPRL